MDSVVPSIRSSDYECVLGDPFRYYLTRRLGLVSTLSSSTALSRGSWFHKAAEYDTLYGPLTPSHPLMVSFDACLNARLQELTESCATLGIVGDARRTIVATEKEDAETALAWYCAASRVSISPKYGTFRDYLSQPYWKVLGREIPISIATPPDHRLTMEDLHSTKYLRRRTTMDVLLFDTNTELLWIIDWKSCSEPTEVRLASCPIEYQTLHSIYMLKDLLKTGLPQTVFKLPENVQVGGMIHIAIQKPSLRFGQQDRNFTLDTSPLKSGPRKGQPRNEKVFHGEPSLPNFIARCDDWYQGVGDYLHLLSERSSHPVVNISHTYAHHLDGEAYSDYLARTEFIAHHATRHPHPSNFLKSPSSIAPYGTLSPFAPFYLCHPSQWPEIIQREGFTVRHRDHIPQPHPQALHFPPLQTVPQAEGTPVVSSP